MRNAQRVLHTLQVQLWEFMGGGGENNMLRSNVKKYDGRITFLWMCRGKGVKWK